MGNTGINSKANDQGDWTSNKEMNPAANSSVTENGLLGDESRGSGDSWRDDSDAGGTATRRATETTKTGDPGRTPGSAEGVEEFERTGNE